MNKNKNNKENYKGYEVFQSIAAGANSIYSFKDKDGNKSVYGFDSKSDVKTHIDKQENLPSENRTIDTAKIK